MGKLVSLIINATELRVYIKPLISSSLPLLRQLADTAAQVGENAPKNNE